MNFLAFLAVVERAAERLANQPGMSWTRLGPVVAFRKDPLLCAL